MCSLTVVTGPPGAGKTVALALWAEAEPGAVAWVCLDEFDDGPESSGPMSSRRCGGPVSTAEALPVATTGSAADHQFLLRLAAALASQDPPVTLVIDDLHLVTDPAVFTGLDFLLRNVGPGLRLLVSSRMDPLLPLHRYRLGRPAGRDPGQRPGLHHRRSLPAPGPAPPCAADGLTRMPDPADGGLGGRPLAWRRSPWAPIPTLTLSVKESLITEDSVLTSYLVEEVLHAQPPEARELLLSTSILEDVSAEAASELTGDEQAAAILPALARSNAFIQPIGRGRYRYHTLLGEVLRLKLRSRHPDRMALLHRRAAQWYGRNGQLVTAVRHAIDAGDWQLAASMVIDELAISEITEPRDDHYLADEFQPHAAGPSLDRARAIPGLRRGRRCPRAGRNPLSPH